MFETYVIVEKVPLTKDMIEVGGELVRRLDELGVPVNAALWLYTVDENEWRLRIATSGSGRECYRRIHGVLAELGDKAAAVPFSMIGHLHADAELVRQLRDGLSTGPVIKNIRFHGAVSGHYIEDALIYRVV